MQIKRIRRVLAALAIARARRAQISCFRPDAGYTAAETAWFRAPIRGSL